MAAGSRGRADDSVDVVVTDCGISEVVVVAVDGGVVAVVVDAVCSAAIVAGAIHKFRLYFRCFARQHL